MSIVRFDPFADLLTTLRQAQGGPEPSRGTNGRWVPAVDIYENGKQELVLKAELPDMKREDIQVVFENNTLTIKGEKQVKQENNGEVLYQGIAARAFERQFQLADHVQVKGANLENGLLHVDLVREIPEAKKPRQIAINGNTAKPKVVESQAAAA